MGELARLWLPRPWGRPLAWHLAEPQPPTFPLPPCDEHHRLGLFPVSQERKAKRPMDLGIALVSSLLSPLLCKSGPRAALTLTPQAVLSDGKGGLSTST